MEWWWGHGKVQSSLQLVQTGVAVCKKNTNSITQSNWLKQNFLIFLEIQESKETGHFAKSSLRSLVHSAHLHIEFLLCSQDLQKAHNFCTERIHRVSIDCAGTSVKKRRHVLMPLFRSTGSRAIIPRHDDVPPRGHRDERPRHRVS